MENKNQPIHPIVDLNEHPSLLFGLTKREYFAVLAMQGILANSYNNCEGSFPVNLCKDAVCITDELLKQLSDGK